MNATTPEPHAEGCVLVVARFGELGDDGAGFKGRAQAVGYCDAARSFQGAEPLAEHSIWQQQCLSFSMQVFIFVPVR